jgi:hypothetical protein
MGREIRNSAPPRRLVPTVSPPVHRDGIVAEGAPDSGTLLLRREEGIEDPVPDPGGHPRPRVSDCDDDAVVLPEGGDRDRLPSVDGLDGLRCVHEDIEENLLEQLEVDVARGQFLGKRQLDGYALTAEIAPERRTAVSTATSPETRESSIVSRKVFAAASASSERRRSMAT